MRPLPLVVALFVLVLAAPGHSVRAQEKEEEPTPEQQYIYQWTDDEGVIHFVDELSKVPAAHRDGPDLRKIPVGTAEPDPPADSRGTSGTGWGSPGASRSPDVDEPDATPAEPSQAERLLELRKQRNELMARVAQLEEGSADPDHADLDADELERLLDQTEKLLDRVDRDISKLEASQDR